MRSKTHIGIRVRDIPAGDWHLAERLAARYGYAFSKSDVVQFIVGLAAFFERWFEQVEAHSGRSIQACSEDIDAAYMVKQFVEGRSQREGVPPPCPAPHGPDATTDCADVLTYEKWPNETVNGVPYPFYLQEAETSGTECRGDDASEAAASG